MARVHFTAGAWSRPRAASRRMPQCSRARKMRHAARLLEPGAVGVIPEAVEASLQLAARLLEALGYSQERVAQRLSEMRERETAGLAQAREQAS